MSRETTVSPAARTAARAIAAGYPAAVCAIPGCPRSVGGIRVITITPGGTAADAETVIMCLCVRHVRVPHAKLLRLLPPLAELTLKAAVRGPEGDHPAGTPIPPRPADRKDPGTHAADNTAAR